MPHRSGYERHTNEQALAKKARAKERHFAADGSPSAESVAFTADTSVPKGLVIGSAMGRLSMLADGRQVDIDTNTTALRRLSAAVPGDFVSLDGGQPPTATGILERRNVLSRMRRDTTRRSRAGAREQIIAANIDVAAIVASAQSPPLHPRFIDRYLILVQHNNIKPVVCLNKGDLATDSERSVLGDYRHLGITAIETSIVDNRGLDELKDVLHGQTAVMVGQSGVGKTSLINALDPTAGYRTGEISKQTGKGQHTTTTSTLHAWDEGSYIIDTPGIRQLEFWDVEPAELQYYYPEFEPYIPLCKLPNCLHLREPIGKCAVKQAIGQPDGISEGRYESYVKLLTELKA